jgi:hypothetical protein
MIALAMDRGRGSQPELFTTTGVWFALCSDFPNANPSFANSSISRRA